MREPPSAFRPSLYSSGKYWPYYGDIYMFWLLSSCALCRDPGCCHGISLPATPTYGINPYEVKWNRYSHYEIRQSIGAGEGTRLPNIPVVEDQKSGTDPVITV